MSGSRWQSTDAPRGDDYDRRWHELAAAGHDVHGEATFVTTLEPAPASVLDAGCGTGRVAVELARWGVDTVGVDLDPGMLATARAKAPSLGWHEADLVDVDLGRTFDAVVCAGNVLIFLAPGTEAAVVANLARHLAPGGALVAGFQLGPRRDGTVRYDLARYDGDCSAAGLELEARFATWQRDPWRSGGDYAVSVHRRVTTRHGR